EPVDIPVEHTERCRDQNGVMYLRIRRTFRLCACNVLGLYVLSSFLNGGCYSQQRFHLWRKVRVFRISHNRINCIYVTLQIVLRQATVCMVTESAIMQMGYIGADQFTFPTSEGVVVVTQQYFRQQDQGFCRFRSECHWAAYAGKPLR